MQEPASQSDATSRHENAQTPLASALRFAGVTLAFVGLCIASYLAWLSLTGQAAPGCGSGAGCAEVLGSRWSAIGPVPISALAACAYLLILGLLILRPGHVASRQRALAALGITLIGAAGWYIFLQAQVIGAWCPYCLGGHGVGVVLGCILFFPTLHHCQQWLASLACGIAFTVVLIGIQIAIPASANRIAQPVDFNYDITDSTGRHLGLIAGKLQLDAIDTPHIGPTDGANAIVLLLDYACPHCRAAHEMIGHELTRQPGLVVFALPTSLHESRNPHIPIDNDRFDHSYELALLSLAVWRESPEDWAEFDRWLFEGNDLLPDDGVLGWPRSLSSAERYAGELIGDEKRAGVYADSALVEQIERNINAIGDVLALSPETIPGLPIVMAPFAHSAIYGRFDEARLLDQLLNDAQSHQP